MSRLPGLRPRPSALPAASALLLAASVAAAGPPAGTAPGDAPTPERVPGAPADRQVIPSITVSEGERVPESFWGPPGLTSVGQAAKLPWITRQDVDGIGPVLLVDWIPEGRERTFSFKDGTTCVFLNQPLPEGVPKAAYAEFAKLNAGRIARAARALPGAPMLLREWIMEARSDPDPGPEGLFSEVANVDLWVHDAADTPDPTDVLVSWEMAFRVPMGSGRTKLFHYGQFSAEPERRELWVRTPAGAAETPTRPGGEVVDEGEEVIDEGATMDAPIEADAADADDAVPPPVGWTRVREQDGGIVNPGG